MNLTWNGQMLVGKVQVLRPVEVRDVVLACANMIANIRLDWLIDGRHRIACLPNSL